MGKWIEFIELEELHTKKKTKTYKVVNKDNGSFLGFVRWFGSFRQYSFFPSEGCVFEKTCLRDIADFMQKLMDERKKSK
jgi:hypothetical protein